MELPRDYEIIETFANIPPMDERSYALVSQEAPASDGCASGYLVAIDANGDKEALAFIDGDEGAAYCRDVIVPSDDETPAALGEEPLVKTVGEFSGETGQIVIKQPEGHWRRYSRWDRIKKAPPKQPAAIVRTLPQCGCGGYLGAPMMFDSFAEMLAYFFVVFSDAQAVNEKHAAIFTGDACSI